MRTTRALWAAALVVASAASLAALPTTAAQAATAPPPMVTLLFSRSELGAAISCQPDRGKGVVWVDTRVAPALQRRGLTAVGTVETRSTMEHARTCLHGKRTIAMSWQDMAHYRDAYGWRFISHGRTRIPLPSLSDAALEAEVRGSLSDLRLRGHRHASGMYAYQNNKYDDRTQAVVRRYYDFGRAYTYPVGASVNTPATVGWRRLQLTSPAGGGRCKVDVASCRDNTYTWVGYKDPQTHIEAIRRLRPGQWLTLQSYVFVEGARAGQWDCTSPDPRLHWTSDAERYCWRDYLAILDALAARTDIVVTDPYSVARAWYPRRP